MSYSKCGIHLRSCFERKGIPYYVSSFRGARIT